MSLVVKLFTGTAFVLATIALLLNINAGVGLSTNQRVALTVSINILNQIPSSYGLTLDNVTVDTDALRVVTECKDYVQTHVPVIPPFDTTIIVDTSVPAAILMNLLTMMEYRGTVHILQNGHVRVQPEWVNSPNVTYSKEYIVFGNAALDYVAIPLGVATIQVETNGTVSITFDNWDPSIGIVGSTGYDAIYDENPLKVSSALPVISLKKKTFNGTAIVLQDTPVGLNEGDVFGFTKRLLL